MKLSVVLATKNEENNIGRCLESVKGIADEIIIFDEFSTDKTRKIAKKFRAKVYKYQHKTNFHETKQKAIEKAKGKRIIVLNKSDTMNDEQKRKISATFQSKKYNFALISTITQEGIDELKEKIFNSFDKLRIFTKEPGKEKSQKPVIMKPNSTVLDAAEKILKGFSKKVKQTKIWGPSSKFGGQIVGLNHKLKDMDVVEFKTR